MVAHQMQITRIMESQQVYFQTDQKKNGGNN